jgi:hypothetical protein
VEIGEAKQIRITSVKKLRLGGNRRSQTLWRTWKLEDGSYNKNGRRKDSKKGSKRNLPYHKTSGKTKN